MSEGYDIVLWPLLAIATVTDLRSGKIPNGLTLPLMAGGILVRLFQGGSAAGFTAIWAVGAAFVVFFPLYLIKTVAAGDVKLLMAVGAWADAYLVLRLGMLSILVGAVVGGFLLWRQRGLVAAAKSVAEHAGIPEEKSTSLRMPFAPAFLCGFFLMKIAELKGWSL